MAGFARRAAGVALGVGGYERRSSSAGAMRLSLRLRGAGVEQMSSPRHHVRRAGSL